MSFCKKSGKKLRSKKGKKSVKLVIPSSIKPWKNKWKKWKTAFYNRSAKVLKIQTAKITYNGGKKKTIRVNKKYKEI